MAAAPETTKLQKILDERGMTQGDLVRLIKKRSGFRIGRDRISKICNGILTNYSLETAVMISEALEVPVELFSEIENVKKENRV